MTWSFATLRSWLSASISIVLVATVPVVASADLDAERIGWRGATLSASKLFLSIRAGIEWRIVDGNSIGDRLMTPGEGCGIAPGDNVVEMLYATDGLGRQTVFELLLDADSGAALQRTSTDSGNRNRHRVYRFTDRGAFHRTRWPLDGEESEPHEQWSDLSEGMRPYPDELPADPVTEPTGLLYLLAAAPLVTTGDRFEILAFARRQVHRVQAEVAATETLSVDYAMAHGEQRKTRVEALKILVRGKPAVPSGEDEDDFEMLGLGGDVTLWLDPATRAPLQLAGQAKIVGRVTFRLRELTLR